jgi:hypothetical protein
VLLGSADYTASNGLSVVLVNGCTAGDLVEVISFSVSSVLNAIPASPSSVGTSYLVDGSVTAAKLASGAALSNLGTAQLADANMAPGSVVQVITVNKTNTFASSTGDTTTWQDVTDLTITITPQNANSRFMVMAMLQVGKTSFSSYWRVVRDGTAIFIGDAASARPRVTFAANPSDDGSSPTEITASGMTWIDSPNTTSAVTYKIQCQQQLNTRIAYLNRSGADRDFPTYDPRTASSFTVMEIAG